MAIGCCNNWGLVLTAAAAALLLPPLHLPASPPPVEQLAGGPGTWADIIEDLSALDLFLTITLIFFGVFTYLAEFIQRKLMERRISKLNSFLSGSVARLQAWDAQQGQLEATLTMVQRATSEYNLLLYLLLCQHQARPPLSPHPLHHHLDTLFDKGFNINHELGVLS